MMNDDAGGRRGLRRIRSPRTGLLAIVVGAALLTAACSSGSSSPQVASLGTTSSSGSGSGSGNSTTGSSTTALPKGNATQLLNEWTACMRSHGDPNQANPTVDATNGIHVIVPLQYFGTIYGPTGNNPSGAGVTCQAYLTAASNTLNGGRPPQQQSLAEVDKFAECMRANGVPNYPEPGPGGGGGPIYQHSPTVQNAAKVCEKKTGVYGLLPGGQTIPGEIEITNPNVPAAHNTTVVIN